MDGAVELSRWREIFPEAAVAAEPLHKLHGAGSNGRDEKKLPGHNGNERLVRAATTGDDDSDEGDDEEFDPMMSGAGSHDGDGHDDNNGDDDDDDVDGDDDDDDDDDDSDDDVELDHAGDSAAYPSTCASVRAAGLAGAAPLSAKELTRRKRLALAAKKVGAKKKDDVGEDDVELDPSSEEEQARGRGQRKRTGVDYTCLNIMLFGLPAEAASTRQMKSGRSSKQDCNSKGGAAAQGKADNRAAQAKQKQIDTTATDENVGLATIAVNPNAEALLMVEDEAADSDWESPAVDDKRRKKRFKQQQPPAKHQTKNNKKQVPKPKQVTNQSTG